MITALELYKQFIYFDEKKGLRFDAKNGKELKLKIKLRIPSITNTKYVGVEYEEIQTMMNSMLDINFLKDVCTQLDLDYDELIKEIGLEL